MKAIRILSDVAWNYGWAVREYRGTRRSHGVDNLGAWRERISNLGVLRRHLKEAKPSERRIIGVRINDAIKACAKYYPVR